MTFPDGLDELATDVEVPEPEAPPEPDLEPLAETDVADDDAVVDFRQALAAWKQATRELQEAWEAAIEADDRYGYKGVAEYPDYMPDLDEFVIDINEMDVLPQELLGED